MLVRLLSDPGDSSAAESEPSSDPLETLHSRWKLFAEHVFSSARKAVLSGWGINASKDMESLALWQIEIPKLLKIAPEVEHQFDVISSIVWCIDKLGIEVGASEVEWVKWVGECRNSPVAKIYSGPAWALDCIRQLQGTDTRVTRTTKIPIALAPATEGISSELGILATLEMDLLNSGVRACYHDPQNSLLTFPSEEFCQSLTGAYYSALKVTDIEKEGQKFDVRWRLLYEDAALDGSVSGNSASGAAAKGLSHMLSNQSVDTRVIVVAACDENRRLYDVGGIEAKFEAIIKHGGLDTIVVAMGGSVDENEMPESISRETRDSLKAADIRVVDLLNSESK